jgi:hypothetical protein
VAGNAIRRMAVTCQKLVDRGVPASAGAGRGRTGWARVWPLDANHPRGEVVTGAPRSVTGGRGYIGRDQITMPRHISSLVPSPQTT